MKTLVGAQWNAGLRPSQAAVAPRITATVAAVRGPPTSGKKPAGLAHTGLQRESDEGVRAGPAR